MQMLDEAVRGGGRATAGDERRAGEPVRLDVNVDAYVPGRLHPLRAGEDRRPPPDRRRARGRRPRRCCARSSRTASATLPEPLSNLHRAPAGADQARPGRRARGHASAAAGSPSRRSSSTRRAAAQLRDALPRRAVRVRQARSCRCACPTTRRSASRRSSRAADALLAVTREAAERLTSGATSCALRMAPLATSPRCDTSPRRSWRSGAFFVLALVARRRAADGRARQRRRQRRRRRRSRRPTFDHWIDDRRDSPAAQRPARRQAPVPDAAGLHATCIAAQDARRRPSRPRASRAPTDAQLKTQCQQEYDGAARPGPAVPDLGRRGSQGEADGPGRQGHRRRRSRSQFDKQQEAARSRRTRTSRSSSSSRA